MWVIMAHVILLFKNLSFAKLLSFFLCVSVSLVRENMRELREFLFHKIPTLVEAPPNKVETGKEFAQWMCQLHNKGC